ncbi:MAG TPA: hypothetical protein VHA10_19795 [Hypericibacter adhaerens]|jgi:hypothetical protein|nr:hypothetical protein [Hypericibacter adhaerens]HWA45475.1 hypothetical protein [Hypericibacter adhaerens]
MSGPAREIIITESSIPILRAGAGLLLLPIGAVFCIVGYNAILDYTASVPMASLVVVLGATWFACQFCCVIARVSVKNGSIEITRPLDRIVLAEDAILKSRIFVLRPSRWILMAISVKGRRLPIVLQCTVFDHTNVGGLRATVAAFRDLLGRRGGSA